MSRENGLINRLTLAKKYVTSPDLLGIGDKQKKYTRTTCCHYKVHVELTLRRGRSCWCPLWCRGGGPFMRKHADGGTSGDEKFDAGAFQITDSV
jgi:hypothetical protein